MFDKIDIRIRKSKFCGMIILKESIGVAIFTVKYDMKKRGLSTLFKHKILTILAEERGNWDYDNLSKYLIDYKFDISPAVMQKYQNDQEVKEILGEMLKDTCFFTIDNNKSKRYCGENQYIKCIIPVYILSFLKKLFISTLVYKAQKMKIPQGEAVEFEFDTNKKIVLLSDLQLYKPLNNPFFEYARNAASSMSVEAIGLENYSFDKSEGVKDFYNVKLMSKWKEVNYLEKEKAIDDKPGVYMLYDENNNTFYVGKAIKLKERIIQHQKNINDPIPNFTHYRYSVISGEYYEFLFLIENAAIHDSAWILDMPKATNYTPALAEKCSGKGKSLNDCLMVNTQEHQTRKQ